MFSTMRTMLYEDQARRRQSGGRKKSVNKKCSVASKEKLSSGGWMSVMTDSRVRGKSEPQLQWL